MCIFSPLNYSKALYCFCGYMYEIEYLCTVKHKTKNMANSADFKGDCNIKI